MYEGLFSNMNAHMNAQLAQVAAPACKLNSLAIENAGKVAEFQLNAAWSYTEIVLSQFRGVFAVKDIEDWQRLVANQNEASRALTTRLVADSQTLVNLGEEFVKEARSLLAGDIVPPMLSAAGTVAAGDVAGASPVSRKPA